MWFSLHNHTEWISACSAVKERASSCLCLSSITFEIFFIIHQMLKLLSVVLKSFIGLFETEWEVQISLERVNNRLTSRKWLLDTRVRKPGEEETFPIKIVCSSSELSVMALSPAGTVGKAALLWFLSSAFFHLDRCFSGPHNKLV